MKWNNPFKPIIDHTFQLGFRCAYRLAKSYWFFSNKTSRGAQVIVYVGENILLVRSSYRNKFTFPGGYIENKETPIETAKRELFEETGIVANENQLVFKEKLTHFNRKRKNINSIFEYRPTSQPTIRIDNREIIEANFYNPQSIEHIALCDTAKTILNRPLEYLPMHPTKSRILIVHENQTVAQNIANILAPADYTVLIALTGQFAIDLFENDPQINIILCDSKLQSTEALKLSKQFLHYQTDQRPVCIILLQEDTNPDMALLAFKAGVFDFLSHPTSPPYLLHCVNKAVQNIEYRQLKLIGNLRQQQMIKQQQDTIKETTTELTKYQNKIEQILKQPEDFINSLSHDIYTPLNEIIGYAEILEEKSFGRSTLFEIIEIKKSCFAIRDKLQPLFDQTDDRTKQIKTEIRK